ncbi:MAG: IS4 family transposase [Deltaproteobacteria bacterium]|nr:IS4 family transposase [Deltaproteobacteria bacterium]
MEAVQSATRDAAVAAERVLVIHDTTDITCPSAEQQEVGFLGTGKAGFYVHHALCVRTDDRLPLGILWSQLWGRSKRTKAQGRHRSGSEFAKQKSRESDRWLEGVAEAHAWTEGCQQVVHVMDREADNFRIFSELASLQADYVIRLSHDRRTKDGKLRECLSGGDIRMTRLVPLSRKGPKSVPLRMHNGRAARDAELEVLSATVELLPPRYLRDESSISMNVVHVREANAPDGVTPVEWILGTTLPIKTRKQVAAVVDIYRARWLVEEFHKALKTGCLFEKRHLESLESLTTLLAMAYPIAAELLRIRTRARQPDILASQVLRPSFLEALRHNPQARRLPADATAEEALAAIARLGGHIKNNGPPGWQTLAKGYAEMLAFEAGWIAAKASLNL